MFQRSLVRIAGGHARSTSLGWQWLALAALVVAGCAGTTPQNPAGNDAPAPDQLPAAVLKNQLVLNALDDDFARIFKAPHLSTEYRSNIAQLMGYSMITGFNYRPEAVDSLFPDGRVRLVNPKYFLGTGNALAGKIKVSDISDQVYTYVLDKSKSGDVAFVLGGAGLSANQIVKVDVVGTVQATFEDPARTDITQAQEDLRKGLPRGRARLWIDGMSVYRFHYSTFDEVAAKSNLTAGAVQIGARYYNKTTVEQTSWRVLPNFEIFTSESDSSLKVNSPTGMILPFNSVIRSRLLVPDSTWRAMGRPYEAAYNFRDSLTIRN